MLEKSGKIQGIFSVRKSGNPGLSQCIPMDLDAAANADARCVYTLSFLCNERVQNLELQFSACLLLALDAAGITSVCKEPLWWIHTCDFLNYCVNLNFYIE